MLQLHHDFTEEYHTINWKIISLGVKSSSECGWQNPPVKDVFESTQLPPWFQRRLNSSARIHRPSLYILSIKSIQHFGPGLWTHPENLWKIKRWSDFFFGSEHHPLGVPFCLFSIYILYCSFQMDDSWSLGLLIFTCSGKPENDNVNETQQNNIQYTVHLQCNAWYLQAWVWDVKYLILVIFRDTFKPSSIVEYFPASRSLWFHKTPHYRWETSRLLISKWCYTYLEPTWSLFWLEKALFWGIDLQT